ncbi:DUF6733 family protein [Nitrospira sp. NS4]|uniref:DUF6733 family protein n=1 Tax=Nitrospira sp. NS4 TaxID=3414498 RepID=UPI003C2C9486
MQKRVRQNVRGWVFGVVLGVGLLALFPSKSRAGVTDDLMDQTKHPVAVTMALQADSFFGFNPALYGTYGLTKDVALAFSTTYWTNIGGVGAHDQNPWLEFDLGLNATFLDKRLSITPMIGTVHGMLLSSRAGSFSKGGSNVNARTTAFDGWVPSLTANYLDNRFEGEFYMGYYKSGRTDGTVPETPNPGRADGRTGTWDFLHYWVNAGYRVNSMFSFGLHYEHLLSTRDNSAAYAQQDYYRWLGPYVEMKLAGGMAFRFTAGHDYGDNEDFYKLKFTKTF